MSDLYDTPDNIARAMAELVYGEILEPAAGLGAIAKHLPIGSSCIEVDYERYKVGREVAQLCHWRCMDFLDTSVTTQAFDTIITNPPFSKLLDFIEVGLQRIKPSGQLVYLMPLSWRASKGRAKRWEALDAHIHQELLIPGRVDYLTDGLPMSQQLRSDGKRNSGRQESDAVFIIKPGPSTYPSHLSSSLKGAKVKGNANPLSVIGYLKVNQPAHIISPHYRHGDGGF